MKRKKIFLFLSISLILLTCSKEEEKETSIIQSTEPKANESQQTSVTQFNLTVSSEQGGSVSSEGGTYDEGTEVTITATPSSDYIFSGWSNGATENTITVKIDKNITLSAISGPDSILMLWKLGSYGLEFSKAFQYVYLVSCEDAKPILVEIVAKTSLDNK